MMSPLRLVSHNPSPAVARHPGARTMPAAIEPADDPIARDLARFRARGEAFVFAWTVACALGAACAIVGALGHPW